MFFSTFHADLPRLVLSNFFSLRRRNLVLNSTEIGYLIFYGKIKKINKCLGLLFRYNIKKGTLKNSTLKVDHLYSKSTISNMY